MSKSFVLLWWPDLHTHMNENSFKIYMSGVFRQDFFCPYFEIVLKNNVFTCIMSLYFFFFASFPHWWLFTQLWVTASLLKSPIDFNDAVVLVVSILLLISNSSSLFCKFFGIVPRAPTTIGVTVTFMFHNLSSSLARSRYVSIFSLSFIFTLWSTGTAKSTRWQVFFWLIITNIIITIVIIKWYL